MNHLWLTQQVATALNVAEGADYRAVLLEEQDNIADPILISESGQWPKRLVQITTIPDDIQHRETTDNRERMQRQLIDLVLSRQTDCVITLHVSDKGNRFGLKRQEIQRLAELVHQSAGQFFAELRGEELWELNAELSECISHLSVHHLPGYGKVDVIIPLSQYTRSDARWIELAIDLKLQKYGRPTVHDIALVIGALGLVTFRQISNFQEVHKPEGLPFGEISLVSPFHGVFCLKPRQTMNCG